jgi:iron complex outermembrane recepter protein
MMKNLPIIMASNAERTGRKIKAYKLIQHGLLITPLLMGNAYAGENPTYNFDLPAQPLSATLDSLAQSAHTKLIYSDATVKGLNSAPIKGNYTAQQALGIVLGQSGLNYKVVDKTLITVTGKPAAASPASATTLKPMTVVGEAVRDPNDPYNKSYTVTNSFTATKTDTPIFDTPVSIQVVPRAVMDDQKTTTIQGAVENVSSVRPQSSLGLSNGFIIRGFRNGRVYRNGLVASGLSIGEGAQFDTANLERVEVLKGPAAVLFGRIEPGGLINLVTKKSLGMNPIILWNSVSALTITIEPNGMQPVLLLKISR